MTQEERDIITDVVNALNEISLQKLYKFTQSAIQMKPRSGENNWGVIPVADVLKDMKDAIMAMNNNLATAKVAYVAYHTLQKNLHDNEILDIRKEDTANEV